MTRASADPTPRLGAMVILFSPDYSILTGRPRPSKVRQSVTIRWSGRKGRDKRSRIADLCGHSQLKDAFLRSLSMNSSKFREHVDLANAHAARGRDATARQAAYIEALARDGHDAATASKLLRAFEEMEALHGSDSMHRCRADGRSTPLTTT